MLPILPYPSGGRSGVFTPVFSAALSADDIGNNNKTLVQLIPNPFSKSGSQVRLTLNGGSAAAFTVTDIWLGHRAAAGNAYDFDGTQVRVTAGGNTTITAPAGGSTLTDAMPYNFQTGKDFLVAFFAPTTGVCRSASPVGPTLYFTSGDTAGVTVKAAGYSNNPILDLISKIEVFG